MVTPKEELRADSKGVKEGFRYGLKCKLCKTCGGKDRYRGPLCLRQEFSSLHEIENVVLCMR